MPENLEEFKFARNLSRCCAILRSIIQLSAPLPHVITAGGRAWHPVTCNYKVTFCVTRGDGWVCFVSAATDR